MGAASIVRMPSPQERRAGAQSLYDMGLDVEYLYFVFGSSRIGRVGAKERSEQTGKRSGSVEKQSQV